MAIVCQSLATMRSTGSLAFVFTQLLLAVFTESRATPGYNEPSGAPCLGCSIEQDVNDQIYFDLATESLEHHVKTQGLTGPHEVVKVTKATRQVVAGFITKLTFNALLGSGSVTCNSKILEPVSTEEAKQIEVTCVDQRRQTRQVVGGRKEKDVNDPIRMSKRAIPGGEIEKDANDPIYVKLAEESLSKYKQDKGLTESHQLIQVVKAYTQVVAGKLTKIDFTVRLAASGLITCHSDILEQAWLKRKEITVDCK